jgi:hypothetical protein
VLVAEEGKQMRQPQPQIWWMRTDLITLQFVMSNVTYQTAPKTRHIFVSGTGSCKGLPQPSCCQLAANLAVHIRSLALADALKHHSRAAQTPLMRVHSPDASQSAVMVPPLVQTRSEVQLPPLGVLPQADIQAVTGRL